MTNATKSAWQNIPEQLIVAYLPDSMRDLLHFIPLQAVLSIVDTYGGTRIHISSSPKSDYGMAGLIGFQYAKALADYAGGSTIEIPRLTKMRQRVRHKAILDSLARGASQRDTARAFDMTERNVRMIIKKYNT